MAGQPIEERVARLEGAYVHVSERLRSIDSRLDALQIDFNTRFDSFSQSFSARLDASFRWMLGALVTSWATIIAAVLLHH